MDLSLRSSALRGFTVLIAKNPSRKKGIVFNFDRLLNDSQGFYFPRLPLFSPVHARQTEYDTLCSLTGITNAARHRNKQNQNSSGEEETDGPTGDGE